MMNQRLVLRLSVTFATTVGLASCSLDTTKPKDPIVPVPTVVVGSNVFTSITAGDFHTCALIANGEAFCWGVNTQGQAGTGESPESGTAIPLPVQGAYRFTSITAGGSHTCGIATGGMTVCWGNNVGGQLGDGTVVPRFSPNVVTGGHNFVMVSASTIAHTCAIDDANVAYCWGYNEFGQLGEGTTTQRNAPVAVNTALTFKAITAGGGHTCALVATGDAYCWGRGANGALGNGEITDRPAPTLVSGGLKFQSIAAGLSHTCGVTLANEAYCWGDNIVGALGNGTTVSSTVPVLVSGLHDFVNIVVGERHGCGTTGGGETLCWGYNVLGSVGDGTRITRTIPVPLVASLLFVKVAAGGYHTCGITAGGKTYCWGDNSTLQLGSAR